MSRPLTIAFVSSRGIVNRNILRTGILERLLADPAVRILLIFPESARAAAYLAEEFRDPRITIAYVPRHEESWIEHRLWRPFVNNFVYTESTDVLARVGSAKVKPVPRWWYPIHRRLFTVLSRRPGLKTAVRRFDRAVFRVTRYDRLFRTHRPAALFSGSVISTFDLGLMKAAERHGVPTVAMQKGWDNLHRQLIRNAPDRFLTQNELMRTAAVDLQHFAPSAVEVVGFPQFDVYVRQEGLVGKGELLRRWGYPPETRIVLYGSEGVWTPKDDQVIRDLLAMRADGAFPFPVLFLLRPHFSDVRSRRYEVFRGTPGVIVSDDFQWGDVFDDAWDPSRVDLLHFASVLRACDAMVCFASTLSLDAACVDLPILNVGYGATFAADGTDITGNLLRMEHYRPVVDSGGVEVVNSAPALRQALVQALQDPGYRAEGRARLRETMCGPLDGRSGERIAATLHKTASGERRP